MNIIEAITGAVLFGFACMLLFAIFIVPFILAWYVTSLLLVEGVLWWAIYLFVFIVASGILRWSIGIIIDIKGEKK